MVFVKLNQNDYKYWDGNAVYQITALPTVIAAVSKVSSRWPRSRSHMNCCCFVYFTFLSFLSLQLGNADSASTNPPSVGTGIVKNTYIHDILWQKQTTVRQWVNWLFLQKVTWLWFLLKEFPVSMYLSSTCELFVIVQKNKYKYNISEWDMSQPFHRLRLRLLQKVLRKKQHVCPNLSTG